MTNQQAVVDQIVQNLAFEVEAVPKTKSIQDTSISPSAPLNVKIKVKKKYEILKQHDVSSIADGTRRAVHNIRLVNSDRTIMSFDVFMEPEFEKKPSTNRRKHIFDMLRPGICLGAVDDDEYPYMPSSSYIANITEPSVANKSDGTLKQTFTLSKNVYQTYTASTQSGGQKWLFGKCKPGGCLDPPFSEDKYSYKPSIRAGPEREGEEILEEEDVGSSIYSKEIPITLHDEKVQNNGRHSSIFDSRLFKKKRKSSDKSTNTKLPDKTDSIVDIYQGESSTNSVSAHSNSIITYPPKVKSDPRISDDKSVRKEGPTEDKSRKSFNDHSEPYFICPKGVNRIKEKKTLDLSTKHNTTHHTKYRSSDATDLKNSRKESFKMPVPLPVPIPIMSNKRNSEVIATNDKILKTQTDSAKVTELDVIPDQKPQYQESQYAKNIKDTDMPLRLLHDTSATGDTDEKLMESSKIATLITSNIEQPITPDEIDEQNLYEIKLQPLNEIDSVNNIEVTAQPSKNTTTEALKVSLPGPVPLIFSEANRAAALDPKMIKDNLRKSEIKLPESEQSFETKTTPPIIKDTQFEDSKEMQQNIDPGNRSGKSASTATAKPTSQFSDIEAYAIPENYLGTSCGFSHQESDIENLVTIAPTIEEVTKRDSKGEKITEEPVKKNDIKDKDSTATAVASIAAAAAAATAAAATAATVIEESSEIYNMPDSDTQQIKGSQQISLSKLPILKRGISILSGIKTSAASVTDKTKRSDSPDKHLGNVRYRDTDKSISILSQGKTSTASVTDKTKSIDSPDKNLDNVGYRDTDKIISILSQGKKSPASFTDNTKSSDSPDKDLDYVGHRDADKSISILSRGNTSPASVTDNTKRSDSPDKHLDNVGYRDNDSSIFILNQGKTSVSSVIDKTKRSDSPDLHLDNVGHRDTDKCISILSQGNTSAASVTDKTKRSDSPDKHLDNVGQRDTDKSISILSEGKTSAASVTDKTKRIDSPDKHLDNVGQRDTDKSISILSEGKTSAASVTDKTKSSDCPDKHLYNVGYRDIHKSISILSQGKTSAASVTDKTKRSDSPDKHLDNVGQRDNDKSISILSQGKTSAASVTDKTKRSDSPDKHLDNVGQRDTDKSISILSRGNTSAASITNKTKRSDSQDEHLDNIEYRDTDKTISILSQGKTSAASVTDKTKRSDSPDKHFDNVGHRDTDKSISIISRGKTSVASVTDKTKRSDSPDKYLHNVGYRDTDKSISILSRGNTSAASVTDKTKRSDGPDKHLDNVGQRDTDKSISILSEGKTSAASVTDKTKSSDCPDKHLYNVGYRYIHKSISIRSQGKTSAASVTDKTKRSDSPDKHLDNVGQRDNDKRISILSQGKTSAASVTDKTKRSDSPDKHLDNVGQRDTDKSISILSRGNTSAASITNKTKRTDSQDEHLDNIEYRDTDKTISILSQGKTSAASVTDKTKRSDSRDKHFDNVGHRDTDKSISIISRGNTSAASVTDKTKRSDSPDKHLDNVGQRDTDKSISMLSQGRTSVASVTDKTKRSDSLDKHLDNVGYKDTDKSISILSRGKTSPASFTDNTKRSDSPDKHLDNFRFRDTDKSISILSQGKTSAASVTDKTKRSDSPDKHLDNVGYKDTDKSISILSRSMTSPASVTDKTKRSNSPDKLLGDVRHRDTDFDVHKDEKRTSLASEPKYKTDTRYAKISEPPSGKEYVSETEKSNNDDNINSYTESQARFTGEGNLNFKVAPIIIDNTEPTPNFKPLEEVYSEKNSIGGPMNTGHDFNPSGVPFTTQIASKFRKFDEDDSTHSTVSRELIGTKSVIYDTDEYIPPTYEKKNAERIPSYDKRVILPVDIVIPSIQSTSTLKSAMKKDTMSVELGFRSYLNDKNERMLRTFDTANAPKRSQNDSVTVLKSQIRISSNEIRIPIDSEHDMSIEIKKSNANQRVSISGSGFVNVIDKGRVKEQRSPVQYSDAEMRCSEEKTEVRKDNILESDARSDHFIDYYEQELVPLQLIIKNLRDDIDVLAAQQLIFKDKLFCANKSKIPRLVHSNKKCFGCLRK